ncbi:MAG: hypothetical protein H0W02_20420 [Ktedonobacteraceae bacterium]|nr:hypothetical protein [Ktedonobacteraceae bacterium]
MDSHEQPIFHLEVTVPRIVFSTGKQGQHQDNAPEQAHLLALDLPPSPHNTQQYSLQAESISTAAGQERFHMLRLEKIPATEQVFLLQVLRQGIREQLSKGEGAFAPEPADEVAFRVEFRQQGAASAEAALQSGVSRIVILLDNAGRPGGYSIDGTEVDS